MRRTLLWAAALGAIASIVVPTGPTAAASRPPAPASWPIAGHDLSGSRDNPAEHHIGVRNVAKLAARWSVAFPGNMTATPAVVGRSVYLADYSGNLWSLDASTGATRWTRTVASYTGVAGDVVKATPAVAGGRVIVGDQPSPSSTHAGARIFAVSPQTGTLLWSTVVDTTPVAKISGAATVDGNVVYVGVSSNDEATNPCGCTFRGKVVALDARTGRVLWQTYTVPAGYTGGSVWGGSPVVDHRTGLLYVGTGNNYSVPAGVCATPTETSCAPPAAADHFDSILAFSIHTGRLVWSLGTLAADADTIACRNTATCGPDYGFGSAPNEFTATVAGHRRLLVGDGSKNGVYYAADALTGRLVWKTQVGPAGLQGGIQWGSATDGRRIYVAISNSEGAPFTLQPSGATTTGGGFSALDPATGRILWQTADPQGVGDLGFMSTANGVVYGGSTAISGDDMYALKAANGDILWRFAGGGSVMGGAAIVNGSVYWAAGYYTGTCPGAASCASTNTLYAFALPS